MRPLRFLLKNFFYSFCSFLARGVFQFFCRVHVVCLEQPPKKGAIIVACNHISHFDPPLLSAFFPQQLHLVAMEELFSHPLAIRFFSWLSVIPIDRFGKKTGSNREAFKKIKRRFATGNAIGLFPEGGIRSGTSSILKQAPMKPGLANLSFSNQLPIIPCVILGSDRLYCKRAWFQRAPLWIIIGKAIHPPSLTEPHRKKALYAFQQKLSATFPALQQELCERFQLSYDDLPKTAKERA